MDAMYPYASPYNAFGNNPIYYVDPSGAVIEPSNTAKPYFEKLKAHANLLVKNSSDEIQRLSMKIAAETGSQKEQTQKAIDQHAKALNGANAMLREFEEMDRSSTVYKIKLQKRTPQQVEDHIGGYAGLDLSDKEFNTFEIMILFDNYMESDESFMGRMAHEMKHGYQYQEGKLSYRAADGKPTGLYDIEDEVEAYQRQRDLGLETFPKKKDVTEEEVRPKHKNYEKLPSGQITMESIVNPDFPLIYRQQHEGSAYYLGRKGKKPELIYHGWQEKNNQGAKDKKDGK